jgi:quercetin dioxygenase-like cupin family protein
MKQFLMKDGRKLAQMPFGKLSWLSGIKATDAQDLTIMEVHLNEGGGHSFHRHPTQEELIYVVEGRIEQWLEKESKILGPGDAVFIPRDTVHASFNVFAENARVLAILGPCRGEEGYEVVDVFDQAPWNTLRKNSRGK